jgi:spore maturation protein CgeB
MIDRTHTEENGPTVLYIGELTPYSRSSQRAVACAEAAAHCLALSYAPLGSQHGPEAATPSPWQRLWRRLRRPQDPMGINRKILDALAQEPVALLLIDQGDMIRPETLRAARGLAPGVRIALFTEDNLALPHNRSVWQERCFPLYDLVVTAKRANLSIDELPALGAKRIVYLAQGFDPVLHAPPEPPSPPDTEIGFVGTFESERAAFLLALARAGLGVRVAGNGWRRMRRAHPLLTVDVHPLYGPEYAERIGRTAINLGLLRERNRDRHTSRTVEIPACGGFLLAPRTEEAEELFVEGQEAEFFADFDEAMRKIRRYLEDERARRRVAASGRARCQNSDYSHLARMREVLRAAWGETADQWSPVPSGRPLVGAPA